MKEVYILVEAYEGQESNMTVYGSIGDAVVGASEQAILMAHEHNVGYNGTAPRFYKWKQIYERITG